MVMSMNWGLLILVFFVGGWVFCSKRKHLLSMLLSLEFIVLSLFVLLFMFLNFFDYELYFSMVFLTFSVCEGALGLSVLVSMIRTHGNDFFQTFSILQC
uniref:NADH-ubiquinone oxidoreductase chain 4L n=1 Tax=Chizuella bonneti TaxID=420882 RepID=A0A1Q1MPF4_9ORTH|nr:NADH dehydrogenase subunit 4L [Metrioptera bonneti]AQM39963.1 NADH dehydrogenase subunit 4L [Metrioptera bonneti]QHX99586.1 NADH dehydrogenase subunit 4L [Metrioptera bonneti]